MNWKVYDKQQQQIVKEKDAVWHFKHAIPFLAGMSAANEHFPGNNDDSLNSGLWDGLRCDAERLLVQAQENLRNLKKIASTNKCLTTKQQYNALEAVNGIKRQTADTTRRLPVHRHGIGQQARRIR